MRECLDHAAVKPRIGGMYRCEATSPEGFVQQLAVSYLGNGYWFYVTGQVPSGKSPESVDRKLIEKYGIDISKWARARRKQAGLANLQYLRYEHFFVLLATHGEHPFFAEEAASVRDARRVPIRFRVYSISHRGGHPHVRIEQEEYKRLKAYFVDLATRRSSSRIEAQLRSLRFEPYAPVRRQLLTIHRAINRERKRAGFEPVPNACFRFIRRVMRPFDAGSEG
jgi:hypothetical protein